MLEHLLELRTRLITVILIFTAFFLLFFYFSNPLFVFVVSPLLSALPAGSGLIATRVTAPVFTPLNLAANCALLSTVPLALQQMWGFMAPGLYSDERRTLRGVLIFSSALFVAGILFCFYLVLPFMCQFFIQALPSGVTMMPDMTSALDFITHMLLIFGLCFQVPLICLMLVRMQWCRAETLKLVRPYVTVGAFIAGMLLTPPDVLSQIMLAVPLCLLYELGIVLANRCAAKVPLRQ